MLCRLPPAGHGDILHECVCIYIYICIHACLAIHDVVSDDDKVGDDGGDDNNGHSGDFADNITQQPYRQACHLDVGDRGGPVYLADEARSPLLPIAAHHNQLPV